MIIDEKWLNILQKSIHTARFLKDVWPFFKNVHESVIPNPLIFGKSFLIILKATIVRLRHWTDTMNVFPVNSNDATTTSDDVVLGFFLANFWNIFRTLF